MNNIYSHIIGGILSTIFVIKDSKIQITTVAELKIQLQFVNYFRNLQIHFQHVPYFSNL